MRRKLSTGSVALAASEVDRVLTWLDGPGSALATGVIHGDASPDNAVLLDGTMVLIDFELAGVGPIAYDLSPVGFSPDVSICRKSLRRRRSPHQVFQSTHGHRQCSTVFSS